MTRMLSHAPNPMETADEVSMAVEIAFERQFSDLLRPGGLLTAGGMSAVLTSAIPDAAPPPYSSGIGAFSPTRPSFLSNTEPFPVPLTVDQGPSLSSPVVTPRGPRSG